MKRASAIGLLLGTSCWMGCTASPDETPAAPPPGYSRAYIMRDCAPWDGPAIAILLTNEAMDSLDVKFPMVRVMIYPRGELEAGRTYRWPQDPEVAAGNRCTAENDCAAALRGEVTLTLVRPDTAVGRARLAFANGLEIVGGIRAAWLNRQVLCG